MKRFTCIAAICALSVTASGKTPQAALPDYTFTTVMENPITPVRDQYKSGTCWAFSSIGFLESEVIRINRITDTLKYPDFSEFFIVSHSYRDRADKYIRLDGNLTFSAGSQTGDVLQVIKDYGLVPQDAMPGMNYGTDKPVQAEMDAVLKAFIQAVAKRPNKTLTTAWKRAFGAILDEYLGKFPETFTVDGKEYTPASYREAMKIVPDDYISLTSYTHHPFYTKFALEVADNWRWAESYNIPIDELMTILDSAINKGYTAAWATDVSQYGFTRNGMAVLLDKEPSDVKSDQENWVGKEENKPVPVEEVDEKEPSQESRQIDFDNKTMTDDHGMQIYGIAKDENGKKYYMVKNSWGETGKFKGMWYATENFVKGQTLNIILHKSALPSELKKKLGI